MPMPPRLRIAALKLLRENGKMTTNELAEELGTTSGSMRQVMTRARDFGLVHIGGWQPQQTEGHGGDYAALWKLGAGTTAKRPTKPPPTEDCRRYRVRHAALVRARDRARKSGTINHYLQLIAPCQSAPMKQPSAKA
jgi:hypothetical protein